MSLYELAAVARTPQQSGPPTLAEIGPIVAPKITWTRGLGQPGSIAFSCTPTRLPESVRARLVDLAKHPTEVWLYRDGVQVMTGLVTGYQIQGSPGTLTVTTKGLLGYCGYMMIVSDLSYSQVDQTLIAKALVDQWQNLDYGDYGIDTSAVAASGVLRDRKYKTADQHFVDQAMLQLGQAADGFDVDVDPASRQLLLIHPQQGRDLSQSVVLDARNITDAGVTVSVAAGDIGSDGYGVGGDGQTSLTSHEYDATVRQAWGRAAVASQFDGVTVQATLDQHTQAYLDARTSSFMLPGPGLVPVSGADVGDFAVGDTVTYEYDAGLGLQSGAFRVASRQVSVNEDGVENMAVSFA